MGADSINEGLRTRGFSTVMFGMSGDSGRAPTVLDVCSADIVAIDPPAPVFEDKKPGSSGSSGLPEIDTKVCDNVT